jgi:hypothetical protein
LNSFGKKKNPAEMRIADSGTPMRVRPVTMMCGLRHRITVQSVPNSTKQPNLAASFKNKSVVAPHELYEQRGRDDGYELDDWLQAESEVTQQKAKTVAA